MPNTSPGKHDWRVHYHEWNVRFILRPSQRRLSVSERRECKNDMTCHVNEPKVGKGAYDTVVAVCSTCLVSSCSVHILSTWSRGPLS